MTQLRSRNQHFLFTALLLLFSAALCYGEVSPREALRQAYLLQDGMNLPTGLPFQQRLILASHMAAGYADADELQSEMQNLLRGAEPTAWLITSDTAYSWSIDQWVPDSRNTYSYGSGKQTVWLSEDLGHRLRQMAERDENILHLLQWPLGYFDHPNVAIRRVDQYEPHFLYLRRLGPDRRDDQPTLDSHSIF